MRLPILLRRSHPSLRMTNVSVMTQQLIIMETFVPIMNLRCIADNQLLPMSLMLLYNAAYVEVDLQATLDLKIGDMLKKSHSQNYQNQKQIYV
jgi:hypothetical protein